MTEKPETITIVVHGVKSFGTVKMSELKAEILSGDFVGPLDTSSLQEDIGRIEKQKILFVAGGLGTAPVYPQVKWFQGERMMLMDY